MQSVFGFHDRDRFAVYLYTTSPWDGSGYRPKIATRVDHLLDVSSWPTSAIIEHILHHQIHICACCVFLCAMFISQNMFPSDQLRWLYQRREK